jgi:hypothetical protein
VVTIQQSKNNNSQEKDQEQRQYQTFIMFRSRANRNYSSLKRERYHRYNHQQEQPLRLYHLSYRFNAETFRTIALCNVAHWIDWGTPFEIFTVNRVAEIIIQNKQEGIAKRLICKRCILKLAHLSTEQVQAEISRIYGDDKSKGSESRLLNQSQKQR